MSVIAGIEAALLNGPVHLCVSCNREGLLGGPNFTVLVTTFTDADTPLQPGSPVLVTWQLCDSCRHLLKRPKKLLKRFMPRATPRNSITIMGRRTPLGEVVLSYLEPVVYETQRIAPATWFEGDAASMASLCRDLPSLKKHCAGMERIGLRAVGCFSSEADRFAAYHFGLMFGQESEPFIGPPNVCTAPRLIGTKRIIYLVMDHEEYAGAIGFDMDGYHTLSWVWLRPESRRQGILTRYWPVFESSHPRFKVLTPLSPGMRNFLSRHGGHELTETTG